MYQNLTLIGMRYESKKNGHLQRHLGTPIDVNFHLQKCFKIFSKKSADKVLSKMDRGWKVPYFMPIRVKCSKSLSVLMYIPCTPPTYLQKEQYLPSALTQPEFYLDYNVMVRIFWHTIQMSRNCNISNNSRGSVSLWLLLMVKPLPFGKFLQMCSL